MTDEDLDEGAVALAVAVGRFIDVVGRLRDRERAGRLLESARKDAAKWVENAKMIDALEGASRRRL
jgi:hypothetical protein